MTTEITLNDAPLKALLVLPRLRIQNANAISSPLTWGFPAITAFTGLMAALERRLGPQAGITLYGVGVICHGFQPQVTSGGYTRSFHLTRNPVLQDGGTAGIVEEGRVHLDITLVFDVELAFSQQGEAERAALAKDIGELISSMRVAGGSVMPALPGAFRSPPRPSLVMLSGKPEASRDQFRRLSRRWLPGFALVSRDDLLQARLLELQAMQSGATLLDAWLDLSRLNHRATKVQMQDKTTGDTHEAIEWNIDSRPGWTVPMPVGFAPLTKLQPPGAVTGARDIRVPFQFVESVYSIGQWISPHRLGSIEQLIWRPMHDEATGLYRCINAFNPDSFPVPVSVSSSVN